MKKLLAGNRVMTIGYMNKCVEETFFTSVLAKHKFYCILNTGEANSL